jgi:hypothetical protein
VKIYLAGKISHDDWRGEFLGYRPGGRCADEALDPWPVLKNAIFGEHDYTGPFFVSDDHGCGHGQSGHGNAADCNWRTHCFEAPSRAFVARECLRAIDRSDTVFAWLDDLTAYGTIAEIGYAVGRRKRVWIAYSPDKIRDISESDLWFTAKIALDASTQNRVLASRNPVLAMLRFLAPGDERGQVYFVRRGIDGPVKIGTSVDPQQRLRQLQTACAEKLVLLGTVAGGATLERSIHEFCSAFRMEGEWFQPHHRVLALIEAVCR